MSDPAAPFEIRWASAAKRALRRLPEKVGTAAVEFIYGALADNPHRVGRPLRFDLEGRYSAHRGDYQVVYRIDERRRRVDILAIDHRADSYSAACATAGPARGRAGGGPRARCGATGSGPLLGLGEVAERLGVLCFALPLGDRGGDGAYVSIGDSGVAVINGNTEAGGRRFTLAHEIGHHVFADEYATDISVAEVGSEMERRINGFAIHLLLPAARLPNGGAG